MTSDFAVHVHIAVDVLVFSIIGLIWLAPHIERAFGRGGGRWRDLAKKFAAARPVPEGALACQHVMIGPVFYRNCITVGADEAGLFLAPGPPASIFLKQRLLIPWAEIARTEPAALSWGKATTMLWYAADRHHHPAWRPCSNAGCGQGSPNGRGRRERDLAEHAPDQGRLSQRNATRSANSIRRRLTLNLHVFAASPDTISTLRFLGIVPLAAAILALFMFKNSNKRGLILAIAWAVYLGLRGRRLAAGLSRALTKGTPARP